MSTHLDESQIAGLTMLDGSDAEVRAALVHISGCELCRERWQSAKQALTFLDKIEPSVAMTPELEQLREEIAVMNRPRARQWPVAAVVLGVFLFFGLTARHSHGGLQERLQGGGLALAAALISAWAFLEKRFALTAVASLVAGSALWILTGTSEPGLDPAIGVRCLTVELVGGAAAFIVTGLLARRGVVRATREAVTLAAVGGAFATQGVLHFTCPVSTHEMHAWAFHFSGIVIVSVLAWFCAKVGVVARAARLVS